MRFSDEIKIKVRSLVSKNDLDSALNLLEENAKYESQKDEIVNIKRRLTNLSKQIRIGVIRKDDETIEQNIITSSILELVNHEFVKFKAGKEKEGIEKIPKGNLLQVILAICAVITIIFGFYKFNQSSNGRIEQPILQIELPPSFNQNPPIEKLYSEFLDDFDIGTSMQLVRDKLGCPNQIEKDYINLFEDKDELELERYSYHFGNGSVDIWSDSTKQKIKIIELHSSSKDIKFEIPTLSHVLEMNGNKRSKLGEIQFKDIDGTYRATYIIEGIINDYLRFDFYIGRYGGYRNYVLSNSSVYRFLYEKGIDSEGISSDSILNLIQELRPNSIALY